MRFRVVIQPPAKLDIEAAYLYLREFSVGAANKWLNGIEKAIRSLEMWPRRFGLARESREFPEEIRQLIYGKRSGRYRILYVIRGRTVHVLHVRHGARRTLGPDEVET